MALSESTQTILNEADRIASEIIERVPPKGSENDEYRAHLAGLLAILFTSTVENAIKQILSDFAASHHNIFGEYIKFQLYEYPRLNAKVNEGELIRLLRPFGETCAKNFTNSLQTSPEIKAKYKTLVENRNDFAHTFTLTSSTSLTLNEALDYFESAKKVIILFDSSLDLLNNNHNARSFP